MASKVTEDDTLNVSQVFTPGMHPEHTFVDEHLVEKERLLRFALNSGGQLISISGPSKSGKTVFVERVIGRDNLIPITGSAVKHTDDVWKAVLHYIGTPVRTSISTTKTNSENLGAGIGGEINFGIAKLTSKVDASESESYGQTSTSSYHTNLLDIIVQDLSGTGFVIFIDDFHYIDREIQSILAKQLKELIRRNIKIICASVPYHSDDVLRANTDLQGRILSIDFEYWQRDTLRSIAHKGCNIINIELDADYIEKITLEASGSPQLMQALCLSTCYIAGIENVQAGKKAIPLGDGEFKAACEQTAMTTDYSSLYAQMLEGPKTRGSDRKSYLINSGEVVDVYGIILEALSIDPPALTIRYSELQSRVQQVCNGSQPPGSSIISACNHISIIANEKYPQNVIDWDSEADVFEIRDPYILFYMRWGRSKR